MLFGHRAKIREIFLTLGIGFHRALDRGEVVPPEAVFARLVARRLLVLCPRTALAASPSPQIRHGILVQEIVFVDMPGLNRVIISPRELRCEIVEVHGHPDRLEHLQNRVLRGFDQMALFEPPHNKRRIQKSLGRGPVIRLDLEHHSHQVVEVHAEVAGQLFEDALGHLLVETVHIGGAEWRFEGRHFVDDAASRPDIRLSVIRLVVPDLGRGIVWRPGLGVKESPLSYLRNVHVSDFCDPVFAEENVRRLEVSVQDFFVVQNLDALWG